MTVHSASLSGAPLASSANSWAASRKALVGAVRDITGARDLTLLEIQVRLVEPVVAGASLHADVECLRRGDNVIFARAAVTDDRERLVATATATLVRVA